MVGNAHMVFGTFLSITTLQLIKFSQSHNSCIAALNTVKAMKGWEVINLDFLKFLLILILALPCLSVMNRPAVKVTTNLGRVTGTEETIGPEDGFPIGNGGRGRFFRSFRGIPYAKPPIGELRWKVVLILTRTLIIYNWL
jgi:hypothetical protein